MKNATVCLILISLFLFHLGVVHGQEVSLEVEPAEFKLNDVPLGQKLEVMTLRITYRGAAGQTFIVRTHEPLSYKENYDYIPNENWVTFDKEETTITPGATENVRVFLEVPDDERYLGKSWEIWLNVTPKPNGQFIGLETFTRMLISTSPSPPPPTWPILLAVVAFGCVVAYLAYAIRKKKI